MWVTGLEKLNSYFQFIKSISHGNAVMTKIFRGQQLTC